MSKVELAQTCVQCFLWGFVLSQGTKYFREYRDDSLRLRVYVSVVILFTLGQTVIQCVKTWKIVIDNYDWGEAGFIWIEFLINGVICTMCEAIFIRRCVRLTGFRRYIIYSLVVMFVIVVLSYIALQYSAEHGTQRKVLGTSSRTGQETDDILYSVTRMTYETTALPALSLLVACILYYANLYPIGMLRTLNSRNGFRRRMKSHDFGRVSLARWQWDTRQAPDRPLMNALLSTNADHRTSRSEPTTTTALSHSNSLPAVAARIGDDPFNTQSSSPRKDGRTKELVTGSENTW
ncbi:hypothetical protein FISHEDRAFT_58330 [Fistulina hepatica ATCC 64428]|nr:hypothetical protein FISHEDRAFT_58330 [Fistulina hepatica ATCC 64428]